MAIINGFLGGAGKGMADVSTMMFQQKLQEERDEANFLRDRELRREDRAYDTAKTGFAAKADEDKMLAEQAHSDKQLKAKLDADTNNTKIAAGAKGAGSMDTEKTKVAKAFMADDPSLSFKDAMVLADEGQYKVVNNADGIQTVMKYDTEENDWVIKSTIKPGKRKEPTQQIRNSGETPQPFNFMDSQRGLINGQRAPAENKAPYPEGKKLRGKDGKVYIVKNGAPVLAE